MSFIFEYHLASTYPLTCSALGTSLLQFFSLKYYIFAFQVHILMGKMGEHAVSHSHIQCLLGTPSYIKSMVMS